MVPIPFGTIVVGWDKFAQRAPAHHSSARLHSFQYLTVVDEGDRLAIRFGALPLFRKRVRYVDMREIEIGRLTLMDGWGIHLSLRGGWVWSIWGFDCVVVRYGRRTLRIGTDDAENLAQFLRSRLPSE